MSELDNERRQRFIDYFNGPPIRGDRAKFMEVTGLTKGRVSQLFDESEPFGARAAQNLAEKLGLPRDAFERDAEDRKTLRALGVMRGESSAAPILAWEHPTDLPPGEFVLIPRLSVRLAAGHGYEQVEPDMRQPLAFQAGWIRRQGLKPNKLLAMKAVGDSMADRIHDGDAVVVDTAQTDIVDGRVYALHYDGGERIKVLFRIPGGGLRIHSRNPAYPDIVLTAAETEHVRVIGRVVHVSGEGGL